ncbi:MAG: YciI family protein [Candidatus Nanopelagicales bacterium]|jgi:hypothetical protein
MSQYLLSICHPADAVQPPPDELAAIMQRVGQVDADMRAAGAWVFAGGMHDPSSATVVDTRSGDTVLSDGPFIETKEWVGGIVIVDVDDLDAALGWASRLGDAIGQPIEVRPFQG